MARINEHGKIKTKYRRKKAPVQLPWTDSKNTHHYRGDSLNHALIQSLSVTQSPTCSQVADGGKRFAARLARSFVVASVAWATP